METENIGAEIICSYPDTKVFAFIGELGAGKTAMARGMARECGTIDSVSSPTYAIVNEYRGIRPIYHFDMYRISDEDALFDIGWEDYLSSGSICIVEWSENIEAALPKNTVFIKIEKTGESSRKIVVFERGERENIC